MLNMYQQITIKTLYRQGKKKTKIAQDIGCHRNTVRNIVMRSGVVVKQTREKPSSFSLFHRQIKEWLDQQVTRVRIYELLVDEYQLDKSYDSLCKYIQKEFPKTKEAFGVQNTNPGEEAEIDFGYAGMQPSDNRGRAKTWIFVMNLPYSRKAYYQLTSDQKIGTLIQACINAFEYFEGVPERLKVDNMRTAILKNQHYDLQFNQDFLEFCSFYNTIIKPCTPFKPNQKGKVESDVGYVKGNFFNAREFVSKADMKNQLRNWMETYANQRVHGTTKAIPAEVFKQTEKLKLQPLPENAFSFFNRSLRTVKSNCHINFNSNYYSVPSRLIGKVATLRYDKKLLRIVFENKQVAVHLIQSGKGQYITQRNHLPDYKCYSQTEYQKKYELKMAGIGQHALDYFHQLLLKRDNYWFRSVRVLLGLEKQYGSLALNLSLKRALHYQTINVSIIKNILEKQLYLLDQEPVENSCQKGELNSTEKGLSRDLNYYRLSI